MAAIPWSGETTDVAHPTVTTAGSPAVAAAGRESGLVRVRGPLAVAGVILASSLALHVRDPHVQGSWGFCPFLLVTGAACPACGGLRAVNDLTRGDVLGAASSNLLFVAAIPVLALLWGRWVYAAWTGRALPLPRWLVIGGAWTALVAGTVFSVLRNLPAGAWLAP